MDLKLRCSSLRLNKASTGEHTQLSELRLVIVRLIIVTQMSVADGN
jgi:hypothetical protein